MNPTTRETRKQKALAAIISGSTKSGAARAAGIDRKTLYRWLDADLDFLMDLHAAWTQGEQKRTYRLWWNHPFRGKRPPTGKGTRSRPRFSR